MRIQVAGLSDGIHRFEFVALPLDLKLGDRFVEKVTVQAVAERSAHQVFLQADVSTSIRCQCDRCAVDFDLALKPSYQMFYVEEGSGTSEIDPSELQVIPSGLQVIDISEDVRQALMLAIPLKLLCRPECKGLCPVCGKDQNIQECDCREDGGHEARWEVLRRLRGN